MKASNEQKQKIHLQLNLMKLGTDKEYKQRLVQQYSNGRETSTTELTYEEAEALLNDLRRLTDSDDKMRKKIIHWARRMGWEKNGKADMKRINTWCIASGYLHKELNLYTHKELPELVSQFELVFKSYLKTVVKK